MKDMRWWTLLLISQFCVSANASDRCSTGDVLLKIRPGAAWVMQGDSIEKLKWLDKKQKKPAKSEVEKARQACIADAKTREALKTQARLDVKDPTVPTEKKLAQLILLLDLDK